MFRVKSKVYSMDFWSTSKIILDNVCFERAGTWREYKEIREKIRKDHVHYQTGWLTIDVPNDFETIDKAKEYANDLIDKLHLLLFFAHGHDVPIHELIIYEVTNDHEVLKNHEVGSIWTGKPGASSLNVYSHGLSAFLEKALPLINNGDFVSKTNIVLAMRYYNLAISINFVEIMFMLLWPGLEAMANAFYRNNPPSSEIKGIKEKIKYMLADPKYQMQQYGPDVERMYEKIRVRLFHGGSVDWTTYAYDVFRLKRLMEKVIFKTFNFYDNDLIHYAIKKDDLLAR